MAKIYNALLRNCIEPKIENILRKNQNGSRRIRSTSLQILTIRQILEGVCAKKNLRQQYYLSTSPRPLTSYTEGRWSKYYSPTQKTVAAIMMLYRNTKIKVRSPDGDTDYFDIVAGVLQEDTLASYLFIISLDYVLRTSIDKIKDHDIKLTKERSRRYPAQTITDAGYADDIALLANTPA